jgi:hypothetical protein
VGLPWTITGSEKGGVDGEGYLIISMGIYKTGAAVDVIELARGRIFGDEVKGAIGSSEEGEGALFILFFVEEALVPAC